MRAGFLVKNGRADQAFEIRETETPSPRKGQVLIKVEGFGLNFADVLARLGLYPDAPKKPAILGYDVVGRVEAMGDGVDHLKVGDRVTAFTRFGGYAEYAVSLGRAAVKVPAEMPAGEAVALTTQYATAYFCAEWVSKIYPGANVLIQAAAGGVGTALVQLAKRRKAVIYGTASSGKLDYLRELGVDHPIDYTKEDFAEAIQASGQRMDVIYDSIGGDSVRKGMKILAPGGVQVCYGIAQATAARGNIFKLLGVMRGFGKYKPLDLIQKSKGIVGVNLLRIADYRPQIISQCLKELIELWEAGEIKPVVGGSYPVEQLAEAHEALEKRKTLGKVVVTW